ncbi:Carboxylesterase [Mycena pura]|uniref:Carboxylic ester hydrolase n=1 Tax=Mycena pura TaxID=153505 RepID=A0AAD6YQA9_9AGAR|nr:Carboxylesterase [Mycena pura]
MSFKGIRFAQPATGPLRWEPPVPFASTAVQNATALPPACIQQFAFAGAALSEFLFNTPPPTEAEDCLFLNVWAPAPKAKDLPVLVWIYGGSAFGTASLPTYDGTSFAANQDIIIVTFNYRTNVFGFPGSPDLPLAANNLGFLDQELALLWVQLNIAQFGGDPKKVTIMGQSAGSQSVSSAIARHSPGRAPFRAAIMLSGAQTSMSPIPSFTSFNNFSTAVGCTQTPGAARLACLRQVPASVIRNFTNGPTSGAFEPVVDNITVFSDPLTRIRTGLTARVPFIIGNMQNDGSLFAVGLTDLAAFLDETTFGLVTPAEVRPLYPGLNDSLIISEIIKDVAFLWLPRGALERRRRGCGGDQRVPVRLWHVSRLTMFFITQLRPHAGAIFADLQLFPGAGAWHSSELPEIFGTFNPATATAAEVALSHTMQTLVAGFIKNPTHSPAANWPNYVPGSKTTTLAKLAYNGNVDANNVVQAVESDSIDGPCSLWSAFLDIRE